MWLVSSHIENEGRIYVGIVLTTKHAVEHKVNITQGVYGRQVCIVTRLPDLSSALDADSYPHKKPLLTGGNQLSLSLC